MQWAWPAYRLPQERHRRTFLLSKPTTKCHTSHSVKHCDLMWLHRREDPCQFPQFWVTKALISVRMDLRSWSSPIWLMNYPIMAGKHFRNIWLQSLKSICESLNQSLTSIFDLQSVCYYSDQDRSATMYRASERDLVKESKIAAKKISSFCWTCSACHCLLYRVTTYP